MAAHIACMQTYIREVYWAILNDRVCIRCVLQGYNLAVVYCLDAQFASDGPKFVAGALQALSAMVQLELPHVNVLTKVDLLAEDSKVHHRSSDVFMDVALHFARLLQRRKMHHS